MSAVLPVDYITKTIVGIATGGPKRIGKDYDFLNRRAVSTSEFFRTFGGVAGRKMRGLPFGEWKEGVMKHIEHHPGSPFARIVAVLDNYTAANAASMFKGTSMVAENVLGGDEYPAPKLDGEFVKGYLCRIRPAGGK